MHMAPQRCLWLTVILLAALAGCRHGETVTVSGAVARPGDYGLRPAWAARDYVAAAGGYLAEADTAEASLFRALPDTAAERTADRWPLAQSPGVMPGDQIEIPFKTYAVRLDTVRAIRDLVLEREGQVYRVPEGVVIPGWSERGVMAAVVIGNGEVEWKAGGKAERAGFHYLYLRMHPEQYATLRLAMGAVVTDREALEDAEELHRRLFRKSEYRMGERAQAPPEGYLRVLAGVWPAPKNPFFPGPGMRKKRYDDGRVWTTFPDGRQRMAYPDGHVEVTFPDSSRETRYPDGSISMRDVSGSEEIRHADGRVESRQAWGDRQVTYADGRVERRDSAGNLHTRHADGREELVSASGARTTIYPDGRREHRYASGAVKTVFANGVERTVFSDGGTQVRTPDGTVVVTEPSRRQGTRYKDGRVEIVTEDGSEVTVFPDGRQVAKLPDGTRVERHPDGRQFQRGPLGGTLETAADGTQRTVYTDGTEMVQRPDGTRTVRSADGTVLEAFADGRRVQTDPRGNRLEVFPDGRQVRTDSVGNRVRLLPDGTIRKTFVDPYGYRGNGREGLVTRDSLPFPPGEMTLDIPPFPGSERGAERLFGLINEARQRAGRREMLADVRLSAAAEDHLNEMLSSGYFSSTSPTAGTVYDRLMQKGIPFRSVTQNQAHAPSIEEAHMQLILSAKSRQDILSADWTHVGVAVAQEREEVWVVEIFVRR